jgi:hypothetical protein
MRKTLSQILNSYPYLKKNFNIGFEVEFVYNADKLSFSSLQRKVGIICTAIRVDDDGSIEGEDRFDAEGTAELQLPPLSPKKALKVLKSVFDLVNKYGYCNYSTGLHLNLSPKSDKIYYSLNPFSLINDGLWARIRKDFKRDSCDYCMDVEAPEINDNKLALWDTVIRGGDNFSFDIDECEGKSCVVNLSRYNTQRCRDSRLEIRAMGGDNYHKRFNLVAKYTNDIIKTYLKHCRG